MGDVTIIAASVKVLESDVVKYLEEAGGELMHPDSIRGTIQDGESAAWIQEANIELEALIEDSKDLIVPKLSHSSDHDGCRKNVGQQKSRFCRSSI